MAPPPPDEDGAMPDLSHLSEEERQIILQVLQRQKAEERQEEEIAQKGDKELWDIERQIQERKEIAQRLIGTQDDAICQICQKTKFADGIGHKCFYCQLRSCARCGGRTTSKAKTIWACSLCQKRQQILARTGKWFQQPGTTAGSQQMSVSATPSPSAPQAPTTIARQHSERAIGEAQQPQPQARRQSVATAGGDAQQPQGAQRQSTHRKPQRQNSVEHPMAEGAKPLVNGASPADGAQACTTAAAGPAQPPNGQLAQHRKAKEGPVEEQRQQPQVVQQVAGRQQKAQQQTRARHLPEEPVVQIQQQAPRPSTASGRASTKTEHPPPHAEEMPAQQQSQAPRAFPSGRATSAALSSSSVDHSFVSPSGAPGAPSPMMRRRAKSSAAPGRQQTQPAPPQQHHPAPASARGAGSSSDDEMSSPRPPMPPAVAPVPPLVQSASLTESGGREPPDFSEKELLRYIYDTAHPNARKKLQASPGPDRANNLLFRRHPQHHSLDFPPMAAGGVMASGTSGALAASSNALAHRIRNYLSNPAVSWQPSADQRRLIGHIVLYKPGGPLAQPMHPSTSAAPQPQDVGLKVVGGRNLAGRLAAYVSRVRPGSVADTVGQLRAGDEVLEWNGHSLQNVTPEKVYDIVQSTKGEPRLELIVSRPLGMGGDDFLNARRLREQQQQYGSSLPHSQSLTAPYFGGGGALPRFSRRAPSPLVLHHHQQHSLGYYDRPPTLPEGVAAAIAQPPFCARLELALLYLREKRELIVSLARAYDLSPRGVAESGSSSASLPPSAMRNPYVKMFLLPDRSERSRRQSQVQQETLAPVWNEHFFYEELDEHALVGRVLEVTLWDFDPYDSHTFLGETLIELGKAPLKNEAYAYTLTDMDDDNPIRLRLRQRRYSSMTPPMGQRSRSQQMAYGRRQAAAQFDAGRSHDAGDYWEPETGGGWRNAHSYSVQNLGPRQRAEHFSHAIASDAFWETEGDWTTRNGEEEEADDMMMMMMGRRRGGKRQQQNQQMNGYLSDQDWGEEGDPRHGRHAVATRHPRREHRHHRGEAQQRRPQSATALRNIADWEQRHYEGAGTRHGGQQPRRMPRQQELREQEAPAGYSAGGGYGSDGSMNSELGSVNSAQSMQKRAILQQQQQQFARMRGDSAEEHNNNGGGADPHAGGGMFEQDLDEMENRGAGGAGQMGQQQHKMTMKERKKSAGLMNRLIPGRNGPNDAKRMGFNRSEEVGIHLAGTASGDTQLAPPEQNRDMQKQNSKESTDSSDNWLPIRPDRPLGSFVENLGPGQVVGRQALGQPSLGELQAALSIESGAGMTIDIMQARALTALRQGAKSVPGIYVKAYLMEGKNCVAKAKTQPTKTKSASPQFRQKLVFADGPRHKMLQLTVLADYGRVERKAFLGVAQIALDELQLSREPLLGWFKLFQSSSLNGGGAGPAIQPTSSRKNSETSLGAAMHAS